MTIADFIQVNLVPGGPTLLRVSAIRECFYSDNDETVINLTDGSKKTVAMSYNHLVLAIARSAPMPRAIMVAALTDEEYSLRPLRINMDAIVSYELLPPSEDESGPVVGITLIDGNIVRTNMRIDQLDSAFGLPVF